MKCSFTWTERRLLRLFRKLSTRQSLHLKAEMFSFHSKYFVYRWLRRAPQKWSFCSPFFCPFQWLRCHQTSGSKPKPYVDDRVLVGVKYVSIFNPIFFYQHLTMNWLHREVNTLRHAEEDTMPETIKHFSQSVALTPQFWDTADTITSQFEHEGHKAYFINTIVSYVRSLSGYWYRPDTGQHTVT